MKSPFKKYCYASQHLSMAEHGLLDVCLRLTSGGKNPLYFDGRNMAARFKGVYKDTVYRAALSLVAQGWLIPLNGQGKKRIKASGLYAATEYTVLNHSAWVEKHGPDECFSADDDGVPVVPVQTAPFAKSPTASRKTGDHRSQNRTPPVAQARHSSVASSVTKSGTELGSPRVAQEVLVTGEQESVRSHPICPAVSTGANGSYAAPPEPTLGQVFPQLSPAMQHEHYRLTHDSVPAERLRVAVELLARQKFSNLNPQP
jgi:hypothetical protein